jgi:hypothetical protein
MLKISRWQAYLGVVLLILSLLLYFLHFIIFRDVRHIFIYLLGDLAFLPIEVLLLTLIVDNLLSAREKRLSMERMNMVIGVFFSEMGNELLKHFHRFGLCPEELARELKNAARWSKKDFSKIENMAKTHEYRLDIEKGDLQELAGFLKIRGDLLLRLLENTNLLEHETFTDLLWALNHLTEEFSYRKNLDALNDPDFEHIKGDIKRVNGLLIFEWLRYLRHLRENYPYLFSLAVRINPFDPGASIEVR